MRNIITKVCQDFSKCCVPERGRRHDGRRGRVAQRGGRRAQRTAVLCAPGPRETFVAVCIANDHRCRLVYWRTVCFISYHSVGRSKNYDCNVYIYGRWIKVLLKFWCMFFIIDRIALDLNLAHNIWAQMRSTKEWPHPEETYSLVTCLE